MDGSKRFLILLIIIGLSPLILLYIFYNYRIGKKSENAALSSQKANSLTEYIKTSRSTLQSLMRDPQIIEYLKQKDDISDQEIPLETEVIKRIEDFMHSRINLKEVVIENYQKGEIYLRVPSLPNETLKEACLSIPISVNLSNSLLLRGYFDIPYQKLKVIDEAILQKRKKFVIFFVWMFLIISMVIPIVMLIMYRIQKKKVASLGISRQRKNVGRNREK